MAPSFYSNLGRVNVEKYPYAFIKVGRIVDVRRFLGSENGYNGQQDLELIILHAGKEIQFPLMGQEYVHRFLGKSKVNRASKLRGRPVDILGEGHIVSPSIGQDYPVLSGSIIGVRLWD